MTSGNLIDDCYNLYNRYCHPILFGNFEAPAFWPVIVVALLIFLGMSELGSQNCTNGDCNHYKNNLTNSTENDSACDNIDNMIERLKLNHTVVGWRRAMIMSILISLIILIIYYPGLPDGFDFFLVTAILFLVIYFTTAWFQWHWWKPKDFEIESELLNLRNSIKEREIELDLSGKSSNKVMRYLDQILY